MQLRLQERILAPAGQSDSVHMHTKVRPDGPCRHRQLGCSIRVQGCVIHMTTLLVHVIWTCITVSIMHNLFFHLTIFWPCSAVQTCTVTAETIKIHNIEAGKCKVGNETSIAAVTLYAVDNLNTPLEKERTECSLRCKSGFYDAKGDNIPFQCGPNEDDRTSKEGKHASPAACKGA